MAVVDRYADVQKIYIALYQRAGDPSGMRFWAQVLDSANGNLLSVIDPFANSVEATRLFFPNAQQGQTLYSLVNGSNIGTVVDGIFQALFNRAPDAAGRQFYIDGFNSGRFTAGTIALTILNGAQGSDAVSIANKFQVANDISQIADGRSFSNVNFGQGQVFNATYGGDADVALVRQYLAGVTANSTTVKTAAETQDFLATRIADPGDPIRPVTYTATITGASVTEGNGGGAANSTVAFTVTLDKPAPTGGLVLNVATSSSSTAVEGQDFTLPSATLTVAAGQTTATYTVTVLGDLNPEANEQIVLSFSGSRLTAPVSAVSTIVNDDTPITLSITDVRINEGNPPFLIGTATTQMVFTLNLGSPAPAGGLTFSVRPLSTGTAALNQDYTLPSTTVTVPAGQSSATYTVSINTDSTLEADETVVLEFSNPRLLNPVTVTGTIVNDDVGQLYTATATGATVAEGAPGQVTVLEYQIKLSRPADVGGLTLDVGLDTSSTATFNEDWAVAESTVSFAQGQQTAVFKVFVAGDDKAEANETVVLQFSGAQLSAPVTATGVISNDDAAPPSSFTVSVQPVNEGNFGNATLAYVLNLAQPAPAGGAVFNIAVQPSSTAVAGQDFTAPPATITVPAGQSTVTLNVAVTGDTVREDNETVVLQFSNAQFGTVSASGVINNDDASAAYSLTVSNPVAVEGNSGNTNALSYEVTLNRAADVGGASFSVALDPSSTASNGLDFSLPGNTLTFAAGQTKATYTVNIVGDTTAEPDETVVLNFGGTTLSPVTATVKATGTIVSDDERSISLTTSASDAATPSGADVTLRTSDQADTINGSTGSPLTLNPSDTIDGAGGSDTLVVSLGGDFGGFTTGSMKSVETVTLNNASGAVRSFKASGITGAETYNLNSLGTTPSAINLSELASAVNLRINLAGLVGTAAPQAVSLGFAAASGVATGTADTLALGFNGVGTAASGTTAALRVAPVVSGIEIVNATVTGNNFLDLTSLNGLKELRVTGSGALDVSAVPTTLALLNATGVGSSVVANLRNTGSGLLTEVRTGSGNDEVTVEIGDLSSQAVLSGGSGITDKLIIARGTGAASLTQQTINGFETVEFQGGTAANTLVFNAAQTSDITTLRFVDAGSSSATVANLVASGGLRVELDNTATGAVSGTYQLTNTTGAVTLQTSDKAGFTGTFNASSATSLTVQSAGGLGTAAKAAAINVQGATSVTLSDTATAAGKLDLNAQSATTIAVTGLKNAFTLNAVDFSSVTGLSLTGLEQALTVTTGQALAKVTSLTASGGGGASALTLTKGTLTTDTVLGSATATGTITVTASGLTGGLTLGRVEAGGTSGSVTLNLQGMTGNVSAGGVLAGGTATIQASGMVGKLALGPVSGNTVSLNASGFAGSAITGAGGAGPVLITGKSTANVVGAQGVANSFEITGSSVTVSGGSLNDTLAIIQGPVTGNTATLSLGVSGGTGDDAITLTLNEGAITTLSGTVDGGVNSATGDSLTINLGAAASTAAGQFSLAGLTLSNLERVTLNGNAGANQITGSAQAESIVAAAGADTILAGDGNDSITAGEGADQITGGLGSDRIDLSETAAAADTVILSQADIAGGALDTLVGFAAGAAGADVLSLVNGLGSGDGNAVIVTANFAGATNTFSTVSELVVFDSLIIGTVDANSAAAIIGTANAGAAYTAGAVRIFVVGSATESAVFRFVSAGADALVSAGELTQVVTLTGVAPTAFVAGDIVFS